MSGEDRNVRDGLNEMESILARAEVGRLALTDGLKPYIVPVNFHYHDRKIVFHCAWEGRKLDLLKTNAECCFEVDEFKGEISDHHQVRCHLNYDSVLAFGKARIESDEVEKVKLLQLFAEKYSEDYQKPVSEGGKRFTKANVTECCCVVVDVEELTGRRERTLEGKRQKTMWKHKFS